MDFKFTLEQEALRKEFEKFCKEEAKRAPGEWRGLPPLYSTEGG